MEQYIQAALALGLEEIGISDHAPLYWREGDHPAPGTAMARSELEHYVAEVLALQRKYADRIRVPTTWLVGGADPLTDPVQSRHVAGRTPGADFHDLAGMRHEVFNETERASVFAHVTRVLGNV